MVNALNVPAAGVQAQPWPKLEVPSSFGCVGLVTSRYLSETESPVCVLFQSLPSANTRCCGAGTMFHTVPGMVVEPASLGALGLVRSYTKKGVPPPLAL